MFNTKYFFSLFLLFIFPVLLQSQDIRSFKVDYGKGAPVIEIPALYSKGEVWNEIISHYKNMR